MALRRAGLLTLLAVAGANDIDLVWEKTTSRKFQATISIDPALKIGDQLALTTYAIPNDGRLRPVLLCFYTRSCGGLLESLDAAGHHDWFTANINGKVAARFLKWLKQPEIFRALHIDTERIAMIGYSMGGIQAGAAAKIEPVRGMIYLNSGNHNFFGAVRPYADYLIITGLEQKTGWVDGNAKLKTQIEAAGAYVQKLDLPGVNHVNWRKEKTLIFNTITNFLVERVQQKGQRANTTMMTTTSTTTALTRACLKACEGRFLTCCENRRNDGMDAVQSYSACERRVRDGSDWWRNVAECEPQCHFTDAMKAWPASICSATCESKFLKCCANRRQDGMEGEQAFSECERRLRHGGLWWRNEAQCEPQCDFTNLMESQMRWSRP